MLFWAASHIIKCLAPGKLSALMGEAGTVMLTGHTAPGSRVLPVPHLIPPPHQVLRGVCRREAHSLREQVGEKLRERGIGVTMGHMLMLFH